MDDFKNYSLKFEQEITSNCAKFFNPCQNFSINHSNFAC